MTNLFSIFDPSTPSLMSSNWLAMALFFLIYPASLWVMPSRPLLTLNKLVMYIFGEFKPLSKKNSFTLIFSCALFLFIMFNNSMGLLPYIFTASSHMAFTLSLALTAWVAMLMYSLTHNMSNFLVHLIPQGTPSILTPFMVVIETISNVIRPVTLAIRLSANMIAGHLLIVLLSSATPETHPVLVPIVLLAQTMLMSLEIAVALIQAYVFSVLITLYTAESVN